jgi:integral membrane protein (TIGR01906 family)
MFLRKKCITIDRLIEISCVENHKLSILKHIARWLIIFCFPVLLLTISLAWGFNSTWIFKYGFEKYNVGEVTGLSSDNLKDITYSWTKYINSDREYWDIVIHQNGKSFTLFSENEQKHFKDVKALIWLDYKIIFVTLLILLCYVFYRLRLKSRGSCRKLALDTVIGCGISVVLMIVLGAASLLNFDSLFLKMHSVLFTNDYWSAEGYMLELFPGGFWYDAAFICIGLMVGLTLILGLMGLMCLRLIRSKTNLMHD